ncbi:general odorant-binding protein 56a-like, partial [Copidosoma floridanum]|uniref:general odorant-binding protein 56a-like n=1 Tax=Copidosoma floridanum TaxID=29053 RepID=UPI0006C9BA0D
MKVFICMLAVLFVAVCTPSQARDHKKMNECKKEVGITNEFKKLEKINFEDAKVKCFFTCMLKKKEMIVDGKLNEDIIIEKMSKHEEMNDTKKEIVQGCVKEANEKSDCEVGGHYKK